MRGRLITVIVSCLAVLGGGLAAAAAAMAGPSAPHTVAGHTPSLHQQLAHAHPGSVIRLHGHMVLRVVRVDAKRRTIAKLCESATHSNCVTANGAGNQMVIGAGANFTVFSFGINDLSFQTQNTLCMREKDDASVVGSNGACTSSDNAERWLPGGSPANDWQNRQHTSDFLVHFGTGLMWGDPHGMGGGFYKYDLV